MIIHQLIKSIIITFTKTSILKHWRRKNQINI